MIWKTKKTTWVFIYIKHSKIWSILLSANLLFLKSEQTIEKKDNSWMKEEEEIGGNQRSCNLLESLNLWSWKQMISEMFFKSDEIVASSGLVSSKWFWNQFYDGLFQLYHLLIILIRNFPSKTKLFRHATSQIEEQAGG